VLLCNPPGEAIDGCITPGFHSLAIHVPVAVWERCRALAGAEEGSRGRFAAYRLPPPIYTRLEQQLRALCRQLRQANTRSDLAMRAAHDAERIVHDVAVTAWEMSTNPVPPGDSLRNRARLARRAEEWLRDRLSEAVQIPDLCLALRVSRRELEYAFRTAFDQSPRDFLQALRLNAIRCTLRGGKVPVLQAALDHGITHPGRFAAQYRALFRESPSETYRRITH
jgi:transcriptional regulator GlxA family with amidase domain